MNGQTNLHTHIIHLVVLSYKWNRIKVSVITLRFGWNVRGLCWHSAGLSRALFGANFCLRLAFGANISGQSGTPSVLVWWDTNSQASWASSFSFSCFPTLQTLHTTDHHTSLLAPVSVVCALFLHPEWALRNSNLPRRKEPARKKTHLWRSLKKR